MSTFSRLVLLLSPGFVLLALASRMVPGATPASAGERVATTAPPETDTPDARRLAARDAGRELQAAVLNLRLVAADLVAARGAHDAAERVVRTLDDAPLAVRNIPEFAARHARARSALDAAKSELDFHTVRREAATTVVADAATRWDSATRAAPPADRLRGRRVSDNIRPRRVMFGSPAAFRGV